MAKKSWISFEELPNPGRKTKIWGVRSKSSGQPLGVIKWWTSWRCYTLQPRPDTVWNSGCLHEVTEFCEARMAERKKPAKTPNDETDGTVPNPLATICRKCGNHIQTIPQRCEWDGKGCLPKHG